MEQAAKFREFDAVPFGADRTNKREVFELKRFLTTAVIISAVLMLISGMTAQVAAEAAQGYEFTDGADDPLEDLPAELLSTENLPKAKLATTSDAVLEYLRNRIYANHGYVFKTKKWDEEFSRFDWYEPDSKFSLELLNKFERKNLWNIVAEEKKRK
jgi:hypothetical protein